MELGNIAFGNSRGEFPVSRSAGYYEELVRLFEAYAPDRDHSWREYGEEFENDVFSVFPYYWGECFAPDTEILTIKGWRNIIDVDHNAMILTLNPQTGIMEYSSVIGMAIQQYSGKMCQIVGQKLDILVTPEHRLYVSRRVGGDKIWSNYYLSMAESIDAKEVRFKKNAIWEGEDKEFFVLPAISKSKNGRRYPAREIPMGLWLSFLGWWLAEGGADRHLYERTKSTTYSITISQSPTAHPDECAEIESLIKSLGWGWYYGSGRYALNTGINKQLYQYLVTLGDIYNKHIPRTIMELPSEKLELLFQTLMRGDGNGNKYFTTSRQLADGVQELALKIGRAADIAIRKARRKNWYDCYEVRIKEVRMYPLCNANRARPELCRLEWIDYSGPVISLTVSKNHIIYARRNGKPCWLGNCVCGYEEKADTWFKANHYEKPCYQTALREAQHEWLAEHSEPLAQTMNVSQEEVEPGIMIITSEPAYSPSADRWRKWSKKRRVAFDQIYDKLCAEFEVDREFGCAVHCTCDFEGRWAAFCEENCHDPQCPIVKPNFLHKPSGFSISWYKYPVRSSFMNENLSVKEFAKIIDECIQSLQKENENGQSGRDFGMLRFLQMFWRWITWKLPDCDIGWKRGWGICCPRCGACGHEGCCSPLLCDHGIFCAGYYDEAEENDNWHLRS